MKQHVVAPRTAVEAIAPLVTEWPDLTPAELCGRLGRESVHKLSFNESPYGPSPKAVEAMREAACRVNCYSDMEAKDLRRKIAGRFGLEIDRIFVANGGDEAISLLAAAFVSPGDEVLMPWPTFGQYAASTIIMDGVPVRIPVRREDQKVDLAAIQSAITERTKLIFLCNPNNPTGVAVYGAELKSFLQSVPSQILVCLDEAYAEFVTDAAFVSGIDLQQEFPNLAVIRTFSKIYGLAGIRVGYGIAAPEIVGNVQRVRSPFNVNSLAQSGAMAAIDDTAFVQAVAEKNAGQRQWLTERLQQLGWTVFPSQTNFLFVDTGGNAAAIAEAARAEGFVFRAAAWGYPTFVRISLGTSEQNAALAELLNKIAG